MRVTKRQKILIEKLAEGKSKRQIASEMGVNHQTVWNYCAIVQAELNMDIDDIIKSFRKGEVKEGRKGRRDTSLSRSHALPSDEELEEFKDRLRHVTGRSQDYYRKGGSIR